MIERRKLGNSGLEVSPLCLGGNVFGWTADEATSFAVLDAFVDGGFNFIDTADAYSTWVPGHKGGESEAIIGKWLKARGERDKVVIATKVGSDMGLGRKCLRAAYIREAVEASLARLQTDYIDLYQSHWDDPETPFEETLRAHDDLMKAGKVCAVGASNLTAERLSEALDTSRRAGLPRYESLQPRYNLYDRSDYEGPLQELCAKEVLGVIPYYGLAAGFLTGKYRSDADLGKSVRGQGVSRCLNERGLRILSALDDVAARLSATPAQVALAWLMARPTITAAIASATSLDQLADIMSSAHVHLDGEAMKTLNGASA